jgi:hypothetical protein
MKKLARQIAKNGGDEAPELDMLRALAGCPLRSAHVGAHRVRQRSLQIQRDQFGNIVGTIERIEETEFLDYEANWQK